MSQLISLEGMLDDNGDGQLYIKKVNGESSVVYPITHSIDSAAYFVCGMMIQWGKVVIKSAGQRVNFSQSFSSTPYSIVLTIEGSVNSSQVVTVVGGSLSASGFKVDCQHAPVTVYFMAIGI